MYTLSMLIRVDFLHVKFMQLKFVSFFWKFYDFFCDFLRGIN